jgi:hypothetical protein
MNATSWRRESDKHGRLVAKSSLSKRGREGERRKVEERVPDAEGVAEMRTEDKGRTIA